MGGKGALGNASQTRSQKVSNRVLKSSLQSVLWESDMAPSSEQVLYHNQKMLVTMAPNSQTKILDIDFGALPNLGWVPIETMAPKTKF